MPTTKKRLNFNGHKIFAGMDVHKQQFTVTIQGDQIVYKTLSQPPEPSVLVNYLEKHFPGADYHAAYEAGFSGFWIQEQLQGQGVNCIVVNACDIPTTDKEKKQKRDALDSRKIARSLKNGELTGIHVPDKATQQSRSLIRARGKIIGNQTRCRNRIKSFLAFYGIKFPETFNKPGSHWSARFMNWLKDLATESGNEALHLYLQEAQYLRRLLVDVNKKILNLSKSERYRENVKLLISVPGIATLNAMILLTEIGDIKRFGNLDRLCAYVGLVPNVYGSGDCEKVGDITKRGNKQLRHCLIESSWVTIRHDPALYLKYHELCRKMKGNKAIIRIARKLLNRIRYVLKNKKEYQKAIAK
jgi:transposase